MATTFKCLISILFPTLVIEASCNCVVNDLKISTRSSGRVIQGQPEWRVFVINNCSCTQSQIMLGCNGFQSTEPVDPLILSVRGDTCLLQNGHPLPGFDTIEFFYAWGTPFPFIPVRSVMSPPCWGSA